MSKCTSTTSQQLYNSDGLYAHNSYISNIFNGAISEYNGGLNCEVYDYDEFPDEFMGALFSKLFSQGKLKFLVDPKA